MMLLSMDVIGKVIFLNLDKNVDAVSGAIYTMTVFW